MSGRSVADIVADLRADDEGLRTSRNGWHINELLNTLDALRPPCPTCGGSHRVPTMMADYSTGPYKSCPDCTDGRMSWEWMAAIVAEVERRLNDGNVPVHPNILRSVRP